MAEVLLIAPPPRLFESPAVNDRTLPILPLGLLYIAEYLRERGHQPLILRLGFLMARLLAKHGRTADREAWKGLITQVLDAERPRLVGVECHWSYYSEGAFEVARLIKEIDPSLPVITGGIHVSGLAREVLEDHDFFDAVVIGEGERATLELLESWKRDDGWREPVAGALVRSPAGEILGENRGSFLPPEEVPLITYDPQLIAPREDARYVGLPFVRGYCPWPCPYCNLNNRELYPRRQTVMEDRMAEQLRLLDRHAIPLYLPESLRGGEVFERLAEMVAEENLSRIPLLFDINPGIVKDSLIEAVGKLAGHTHRCRVWLGIETGSFRVRKRIGRPIPDERIDRIIAAFRRLGVQSLHASFLIGLPPETPADVELTRRRARELGAEGIFSDVFPVVAFPGSRYFMNPGEYGIEPHMRRPADFHRLSRCWFAPLEESSLSFGVPGMSDCEVVEAILRVRIEQRIDAGYRIPPELFLFMQHGNVPLESNSPEARALYEHGERYLPEWSAETYHASLPTRASTAPHPPADVYGEP